MIEVFVFLLVALVIFALGYPIAHYADRRNSVVLSPPLGLAVVTILATTLYVLNWSMHEIRTVVIVLASLCAVWAVARLDVIGCIKREPIALTAYAVTLILLFLPPIIGGEQFSVFQGNIWDHFNYLTGSVAYSKNNHDELLNADTLALLADPPKIMAKISLLMRPSVFFLFAIIIASPVGALSTLAYFFVAFLISLAFFSILYLIRVTLSADRQAGVYSRTTAAIVAAVFPVGFWGQYVLDINAWSQAASISLLALFLALSTRAVRVAVDSEALVLSKQIRLILTLVLVLGASVLIYPESSLLHLAAAGAAVTILWIKGNLELRHAMILALVLSAGLLGGLVNYAGTYGYIFRQLEFGVSGSPDWWAHFHQFLLGKDNIVNYVLQQVHELQVSGTGAASIKDAAKSYLMSHLSEPDVLLRLSVLPFNVILGVCGLYFLTIELTYSMPVIFGWMVLAIGVIYGLARLMVATGRIIRTAAGEAVFHYHIAFFGFLVFVAFSLLALGQIWSAGKAISLLAPYLTTALAFPLVGGTLSDKPAGDSVARKKVMLAASLYILVAIALSLYRLSAVAANENGVHYAPPYPAVLHLNSKNNTRWEIDLGSLKQCSAIKLETPDPFVRQYLVLRLSYIGKKYYHEFPVKTYYGVGADVGKMRKIPTDCAVFPAERNGVTTLITQKANR